MIFSHHSIIPRVARSFLLVFVCLVTALARAQSGIGDIVYTVGTVTRDTAGRDWAYLLWQGTQPALISNRVFAVYAKPGAPTNNAPFKRLSIISLAADARVIEPLLLRAQNLGDDLFKLQQDILQVFGSFMPTNSIAPADLLSAVMRGSLGDPNYYQNVLLLARNHPGIDLALGFADAELIAPGVTTFEVRMFDLTANSDVAVIGRVTVEAGNPTILPKPGPPVLVVDPSPKGDLNLNFRWGTPDELRRLGLMQFGYNLYRVARPYAASQGWNVTNRPPLAILTNLVATQPALAKRVNKVPITPSKLFSIPEAADFTSPTADTNTMFIRDDDGRGRANYVNHGFTNGAEFYYYISARDVLGRDGILSPGYLATVCDRMPPLPPRGVHVVNDYQYNQATQTSNQWLRVNWKQNFNTNDLTINYWIYRWTNLVAMNALEGDFSNDLVAIVPHIPGATNNTYLDNGPGSPTAGADYGKTFWYTVRAGDAGACGQNLSGEGGPAFGVLRNRIGPGPGAGFVDINCLQPLTTYVTNSFAALSGADNTNFDFAIACGRLDLRFEWAEIYAIVTYNFASTATFIPPVSVTNNFGRLYFLEGRLVFARWTPSRTPPGGGQASSIDFRIGCRAALFNGKVSNFAFANVPPPDTKSSEDVLFEATTENVRVFLYGDRGNEPCRVHDPNGGANGTNNIGVHVLPSPGSAEYRIYRRVDEGPLSLLCQGAVTNIASIIDCFEDAPPVNGGTLCFFVQFLDVNGNPSPMTPIGCVDTAPTTPLPTPALAKITPVGDPGTPVMNLSWFCAPYGVDRFELRIAGLPTAPNTNTFQLSGQLSYTGAPPASMVISNFGTNLTLSFYAYITPKSGPGFGNNGAQFTVPCNIELGKTYAVTVRALDKNGNGSPFSDVKTFVWRQTNAPTLTVPWPARPLPSTNANFTALAYFLSTNNPTPVFQTANYTGNGVLVGFSPYHPVVEATFVKSGIGGVLDPNSVLLTNSFGDSIFPCALYRYQAPNANFPVVSGTVIQVSPLMENIAYLLSGSQGVTNTVIADPFIAETFTVSNDSGIVWLWLIDTQPQISGARYRYIVVRFKSNHEIDQLIPSTEVDVP